MRKTKPLVVIAMAMLFMLPTTLPASADYAFDFIVLRNEAPNVYEFEVWFYWDDAFWDGRYGLPYCQYDRRAGDYDELWFDRKNGCDTSHVKIVIKVWRSRSAFDEYTFRKVPWNTKLTFNGQEWTESMR